MRVSPVHRPNRYSDDFRADALELLRRGDRSFRQLASDLGMSAWTLRDWWRKDQMGRRKSKEAAGSAVPDTNETPEQCIARLERENEKLRRKVEQLEMDREILKKAAAFFAKESE